LRPRDFKSLASTGFATSASPALCVTNPRRFERARPYIAGTGLRFGDWLARPTKIWTSKEIPNISKLLFGGSKDINGLRFSKIWIPQAFPNFYLAEMGNIKGLEAKIFGKRCFLKFPACRTAAPVLPAFLKASPNAICLEIMERKTWNVQKMFL
jgi:hypothetical protein